MPNIEWNAFADSVAQYTGMEISQISQETNLFSDLGVDSLGLFSLGMFLMKSFKVKIPLSSVATIETLGDIFIKMNEASAEQASS